MVPRAAIARALAAQDGDTMLRLMRPVVWGVVEDLFLPTGFGDRDDLIQEARVGVLEAMATFRGEPLAFPLFAKLCARREVVLAVVAARRRKHEVANRSTSIDGPAHQRDVEQIADVLPAAPCCNVETIAEGRERLAAVIAATHYLSDLERAAVAGVRLSGESYAQCGQRLGVDKKAIDNALQRADHKFAERLAA